MVARETENVDWVHLKGRSALEMMAELLRLGKGMKSKRLVYAGMCLAIEVCQSFVAMGSVAFVVRVRCQFRGEIGSKRGTEPYKQGRR